MSEAGIWNLEKLIQENPLENDPIKRTHLADGAHTTISIVQFPSIHSPHIHHEHDETIFCLKGEGQFRLGDKTYPSKAGDLVFIPAGTPHTPMSDSYLALLSILSPCFNHDKPDREPVKP